MTNGKRYKVKNLSNEPIFLLSHTNKKKGACFS
jgi:hypothetical protein